VRLSAQTLGGDMTPWYLAAIALFVIFPASSTAEKIRPFVKEISPAEGARLGIEAWVDPTSVLCEGASDIWLSIPRTYRHASKPSPVIELHDDAGVVIFSSAIPVFEVDAVPEAARGTPTEALGSHPLLRPMGFHGIQFCLNSSLFATANFEVQFREGDLVTQILRLGALERWFNK